MRAFGAGAGNIPASSRNSAADIAVTRSNTASTSTDNTVTYNVAVTGVGGTVWKDTDSDGIQDAGEVGVAGAVGGQCC